MFSIRAMPSTTVAKMIGREHHLDELDEDIAHRLEVAADVGGRRSRAPRRRTRRSGPGHRAFRRSGAWFVSWRICRREPARQRLAAASGRDDRACCAVLEQKETRSPLWGAGSAALRRPCAAHSRSTSSQTAWVTSAVVALPPRSRVCNAGLAVTCSIACMTRLAASISPRCSSSITTDQKVPTGLARPLPMMSKAEPWIGSNIDG